VVDLAERDRQSLIIRQPSVSSTAPASSRRRRESSNSLKAASLPDLSASIGSGYATQPSSEVSSDCLMMQHSVQIIMMNRMNQKQNTLDKPRDPPMIPLQCANYGL